MSDPEILITREQIDAVIFDLDGVVTRTTDLQAAAWKALFDDFLEQRPAMDGEETAPFDADRDYKRYLDGRPRHQGIQHFLAARNIRLPMGEAEDPPGHETVSALANRKNALFTDLLEQHSVEIYGCALALIRSLRTAGFATAVVTASKNCDLILDHTGIADLFDARVDGHVADWLDLDAKPDPDTFLEAARRLGVRPERTAVVQSSVPGVTAAQRGRFGLVIGVDRDRQREALLDHGADDVLTDLCQVKVVDRRTGERPIPPLLTDTSELTRRLEDKRPALFLDYDGTLTPIVDRPEDARLPDSLCRVLREASACMPVAVVSGRDLADLRARVDLPQLFYAGSHGFEIQGPDLHLELPEGVDALEDLEQATESLRRRLSPIGGCRLERKRFAVAVHDRHVAEADRAALRAAVEAVQSELPRLRLIGGKRVQELRPDIAWDKGRAIRWLLTELSLSGPDVLPIYIGDDETDEDAFRALRDVGIGILVAEQPQPSAATYRMSDPGQVESLLKQLVETETSDA